jgi:hypothetical protein
VKSLRFLALQGIRRLGYDLRRVASPASLSIEPLGTDPIALDYCPSKRGYAVLHIPVNLCRGFHSLGLPFEADLHPFVQAYQRAFSLESGDREVAEITRVLDSYYTSVRPRSASEVIGVPERDTPGLQGVPPIGYVLPWWEQDVGEMTRGRARALEYVGMRYGIPTTAESGHTFFGPVGASKLALQVARLHQLWQSVRSRGFQPFGRDAPTKVIALRKHGEYRWMIAEGQHRFALGAALGVESIPAMVTSVIRREDVAFWPQVINGTFTEKGALDLFDRVFEGRPAPVTENWSSRRFDDPPALACSVGS